MVLITRVIKFTEISTLIMIAQEYINQIKLRLKRSKIVDNLEIIKEKIVLDQGYFRAKIILENEDFSDYLVMRSLYFRFELMIIY